MRRTLWPLPALATVSLIGVVSLISASCGSNAPSKAATDRSGAASSSTDASSAAGNGNNARQKAVKFAECMRNNGVSEFPDPTASGEFVYGIKRGSSLDPATAVFKKAIGACKDLEPAGALGEGKVTPEQRKVRLKFAQCMRDNGVTNFPDPPDDGPLINTDGGSPGVNEAIDKCGKVVAGALSGGAGK